MVERTDHFIKCFREIAHEVNPLAVIASSNLLGLPCQVKQAGMKLLERRCKEVVCLRGCIVQFAPGQGNNELMYLPEEIDELIHHFRQFTLAFVFQVLQH